MDAESKDVREEPGKWLYHYTRLATAVEHILPNQTLRLNPFSLMRDPREYSDWSVPAGAYPGNATDGELTRAYVEASTRLNGLKARFKLLALTQDDPDAKDVWERGYCRSRLWELYAEGGRGVCLILHKETAIREIGQQLEALGRFRSGAVHYKNKRLFEEIFVDLREALEGRLDEIVEDKLTRHMESLFLTKNTEWASESEYRFIVETDDAAPIDVSVASSLVGVCLGPRTPMEHFPSIRVLCEKSHLHLAHLLWWNNDPLFVGVRLEL